MEAWQLAQATIREVDSHPNQPPESVQPAKVPHLDVGGGEKGVEALTEEIDRVEAAGVPLPLAEEDRAGEEVEKGEGKEGGSPEGPL